MTNANNIALIKKDRLRFTKNKLSSGLALLAIVFNALYFVIVYESKETDVGSYYYNWTTGISVLYNLVFMLAAFLASEGVKNYKLGYSYVLMILGLGEIVRIFYIPMNARNTTNPNVTSVDLADLVAKGETVPTVMGDFQFYFCLGCLVAAAALCIIAGVVAVIKTTTLIKYQAELEKNSRGSKS